MFLTLILNSHPSPWHWKPPSFCPKLPIATILMMVASATVTHWCDSVALYGVPFTPLSNALGSVLFPPISQMRKPRLSEVKQLLMGQNWSWTSDPGPQTRVTLVALFPLISLAVVSPEASVYFHSIRRTSAGTLCQAGHWLRPRGRGGKTHKRFLACPPGGTVSLPPWISQGLAEMQLCSSPASGFWQWSLGNCISISCPRRF